MRTAVLLAALVAVLLTATAVGAATRRADLGDGMVAALTDGLDLYLEAPPLASEGLLAFTRRLTGDQAHADRVTRTNGKRPRRLLADVRYRVPFSLLRPELQLRVVQALFPDDRPVAAGWSHRVPDGAPAHTLWRVAQWFTGEGQRFAEIRAHNELRDDAVPAGATVIVPRALLSSAFIAVLPPAVVAANDASTDDAAEDLDYQRDERGDFAVYHLEAGEALYSAVVVRFTGAAFATDVNRIAADLAKLNGIRDVTDMPVGQEVRIPFDLLLPQYLPAGHARRLEYEADRSASAEFSNTVRTSSLEGITVILDAGHGGNDPGTTPGGVWESLYVYDIMLRAKRLLEESTAATVLPTTGDGNGDRIIDRDVLPRNTRHAVLTDPEYPITDPTVGVNLRWYLANSLHRRAIRQSGDDAKTIFVSLHADALHSSLRGAMAYVPAASLTRGSYGKSAWVYTSRREVKERPRVEFSWKERVKSEGLSRELAESILGSFRRHGLRVHHDKPIRDRIIRCRRCRAFVPAVVRRNAVPAKLLLEVCNLNNSEDRRLLQTRAYREQVARALVDGILAYYDQPPSAAQQVASAS